MPLTAAAAVCSHCSKTFTLQNTFVSVLYLSHFYCCDVFSSVGKERNAAPQLTDFEIPTSFWYELKDLTENLMENVNCESHFNNFPQSVWIWNGYHTFSVASTIIVNESSLTFFSIGQLADILHNFFSSLFPSEHHRCCCQCRVPDHVDCVSQKKTQTLQTAPDTYHGVSVESQCCSRSEVRAQRCLITLAVCRDVM